MTKLYDLDGLIQKVERALGVKFKIMGEGNVMGLRLADEEVSFPTFSPVGEQEVTRYLQGMLYAASTLERPVEATTTPKPLFQAVEIASHKPVGKPRNSLQFARSDAMRHLQETGQHCGVCRIEMVWDTTRPRIGA